MATIVGIVRRPYPTAPISGSPITPRRPRTICASTAGRRPVAGSGTARRTGGAGPASGGSARRGRRPAAARGPSTPTWSTSRRSSAGASGSAASSSTSEPTASCSTMGPRSGRVILRGRGAGAPGPARARRRDQRDRPGRDRCRTELAVVVDDRAGSSRPATRSAHVGRRRGADGAPRLRRRHRPGAASAAGRLRRPRRRLRAVGPGVAGIGTLVALSLASLALTVGPTGPGPAALRGPDCRPRGRVRGPPTEPHGSRHARLSVATARSTLLDAREKAGLSSAEFRACEAAT